MEEEIWRDFKRSAYFLGRAIFGILGGRSIRGQEEKESYDEDEECDEGRRRKKKFWMIAIPVGAFVLWRIMKARKQYQE